MKAPGDAPGAAPVIYTFYSYKGGVGRSMALANVAEYLYSRGARVLIVDWDLEAPGLENYFFGTREQRADVSSQLGLIDMLEEYKRRYTRARASMESRQAAVLPQLKGQLLPASTYLYTIHPLQSQAGGLWLLPAGWRTSTPEAGAGRTTDGRFSKYAAAVQGFDWSDFYDSYEGEAFFESLREELFSPEAIRAGDGRGADAILIDSRTGVTEVGGIATRQLADVVVCFTAPNYQNLSGVTEMARSFVHPDVMAARKERRLDVLIVPARVDQTAETALKDQFQKDFESLALSPAVFDKLNIQSWDLAIPYLARYSYREALAIHNKPADLMAESLRKLTTHLVLLASTESRLYEIFGSDLIAISSGAVPSAYVVSTGDEAAARAITARLSADIDISPSLGLARSMLVHLDAAATAAGPEIRNQIRLARQKGVCVYLAAADPASVNTTGLPPSLQKAAVFSTETDWAGLVRALRKPCRAPRVPFVSLTLTPDFAGREAQTAYAVQSLLAHRERQIPMVVALHGSSGMGTTSLAVRICQDERILDSFDDGILWATLGDNPNLLAVTTTLYANLTGETTAFESLERGISRLAGKLAGRACLLVLDAVTRPEDALPFTALPCSRLVVSPRTDVAPDAVKIHVGQLPAGAATSVLLGGLRTQVTGASAGRVAAQLGNWPAALSVARSALAAAVARSEAPEMAILSLSNALANIGPDALGSAAGDLQARAKARFDAMLSRLSDFERELYERLAGIDITLPHSSPEIEALWRIEPEQADALMRRLDQFDLIVRWPSPDDVFVDAFAGAYLRARRSAALAAEKGSALGGGPRVCVLRSAAGSSQADHERLHSQLIAPALKSAGIVSVTTLSPPVDMASLQPFFVSDVAIVEVSGRDPDNVYLLGVREALIDQAPILLQAAGEPAGVHRDQVVLYDPHSPGTSVHTLAQAIRRSLADGGSRSPVFRLLPDLKPVENSRLIAVPTDFVEDLEQAQDTPGDLRLFAAEIAGLPWETAALRAIADKQMRLGDFAGARTSWERLLQFAAGDADVNLHLSAAYQGLSDLPACESAANRALGMAGTTGTQRCEALSLLARTAELRWVKEWSDAPGDGRTEAALTSPFLSQAIGLYEESFAADLNLCDPAMNAVALLTIQVELATGPESETWRSMFESEQEAAFRYNDARSRLERLRAGADLALRAAEQRDPSDPRTAATRAKWRLITSKAPRIAVNEYKKVFSNALPSTLVSIKEELQTYVALGVVADAAKDVLASLPPAPEGARRPHHVLLFVGHLIDAPGRSSPRFPAAMEGVARFAIAQAVREILSTLDGPALGVAGASNGGDILFHEICQEAGVPSSIYLSVPAGPYVAAAVQTAGKGWVERFYALYNRLPSRVLGESFELPDWLREKPGYGVWPRNAFWMLHSALALGSVGTTIIALWNGEPADGPGGVDDVVRIARSSGARVVILDTNKLFDPSASSPSGSPRLGAAKS